MNDTRPIGVFDSGVGGLTVVKSLVQQLPGEDFIYLGDTAHIPYGNKSREELFGYARDIIAFLLQHDVKAIVVACGTHSSITLSEMETSCPVPIVGVVKPGARSAVKMSKNRRIGIIATQATVNSGSYSNCIHAIGEDYMVFANACPRFVPLVESGNLQGQEVQEAIQEYIHPLVEAGIDTLVMGCTHYPILAPAIKDYVGAKVTLVDPAVETIEELAGLLREKSILSENSQGQGSFYASGNDQSFYNVGNILLGDLIKRVDSVNLD